MSSAAQLQFELDVRQVSPGFSEPRGSGNAVADDPFLVALAATDAVRRLQHVRFLGAIDYRLVRSPNGKPLRRRYTRYQHSIGVMRLALGYCELLELPRDDCRLVCAAALLHDVGHPPLSHSMESVFRERFDIDHHTATLDIVAGCVPLGRQVYSVLRKFHVEIDALQEILSGESARFDGFFKGPITFDTIEGVLRSYSYVGATATAPQPNLVMIAAAQRNTSHDRKLVDEFWRYKDLVYRHIINSRCGVLADVACRHLLRQELHRFSKSDFFSTEKQAFGKLRGLKTLLQSPVLERQLLDWAVGPVGYRSRKYFVEPTGDFFGRRDNDRYRQERTDCRLVLKNGLQSLHARSDGSTQDVLFSDHAL